MTYSFSNGTVTTPENELTCSPTGDSDAATLADELGRIGVQTVDSDKIRADVEKIDVVDRDTVRLWYRFPTGELIPEDFEKPMPWSVTDSKLARVATHAGVTAETFSGLETREDAEVVLEETTVPKSSVDLEALAEAAPLPELEQDTETAASHLYYQETGGSDPQEYVTWQAVDPKELVDDDRYSNTENESGESNSDGVPILKAIAGGFGTAILFWAIYLVATWSASALNTTISVGGTAVIIIFGVFCLAAATVIANL